MLGRFRTHFHRLSGHALVAVVVVCLNVAVAPCLMAMPSGELADLRADHCESSVQTAPAEMAEECPDCLDPALVDADHCPTMAACADADVSMLFSTDRAPDLFIGVMSITQDLPRVMAKGVSVPLSVAVAPPESLNIRYCRFLI